jgi:organic hydroperoxide reductase OsmC/OhrA
MTEYRATTRWTRTSSDFTYDTYNRDHEVTFGSGHVVPWSSAPEFKGNADRVNPEETFLAVAARKRIVVENYVDEASGVMERNDKGKYWVSKVTLRPKVTFSGDRQPSPQEISALHHAAHENCFIANSVTSSVSIDEA